MAKKHRVLWIIMLFLLINFVNGELISVDPCAGNTVITQDVDHIYMESGCYYVEFPKTYGNEIIAYDKYNDDYFDLKALQLYDRKTSNPIDHKTISFQDKPMIASYSGDTVYYTMNDGVNDITLTYTASYKSFKQGIMINDWTSNWVEGDLVLRTKYHKDNIKSHFENQPAVVDGIEQELIIETVTEQESTFYEQLLFRGASFNVLIQDPLYTVDYSPNPALHLIDGFYIDPDTSYVTVTDITTGISDNSTATKYLISDTNLTHDYDAVLMYKFEETSGNTVRDYALIDQQDMDLYGTPNLNVVGALGSAIDFDGVSDYGIRNVNASIPANYSFMGCIALYDVGVGSGEFIVDNKGGGTAQGFEFALTPSDTVTFFVRRGSTQDTLISTTTIDDSAWHTICGLSHSNGSLKLWIDGVLEDTGSGVTGSLISTIPMHIGESHTGGSRYSQEMDEFCAWVNPGWDNNDVLNILNDYESNYCGYPEAYAISGRWSETYDPGYDWYLTINKQTPGTQLMTIYPYNGTEDIDWSYSISDYLVGIGDFSIDISSLLDYQLNNLSLNHTRVRIITSSNVEVSEMFLRKEVNDTSPPIITDCQLNDTYLVNDETVRLQCNITDNIDVDEVNGTVSGVKYIFNKNYNIYYRDFSCGASLNGSNAWTQVEAVDVSGNYNYSNLNLSFYCNYTLPCSEDWLQDPVSCLINDSYLISYTDQNACGTFDNLPGDNGTYGLCNYCSEDLEKVYTSECYLNGTVGIINFTWQDNNYLSCCVITNQYSDCSILLSPYNQSGVENCLYATEDFLLEIDSEIYFGFGLGGLHSDKAYGKIWLNDTNNSYKCISYVKTQSGDVIQTNPVYTKRVTGLTQIFGKEYEDREFFTTQNGIANVYWTNDNLVIDERLYLFGVECSGNGQRLVSEQLSTVGYDPVNAPITRWFWLKDNITPIVLGLLLLFIIIILMGVYLRQIR